MGGYLSTVLDDFSRYIVAWKLCTNMRAEDVTATLDLALKASGLDQAKPADRPRLLSDNGSSYVAGDLAKWLGARNIKHLRGAPYHPMTQGKIERWHQTLKNRILLENYFLSDEPEAQIAARVMATRIAVVRIDLGKNSCSLVGLDQAGAVVRRRRMRPGSNAFCCAVSFQRGEIKG